MESDYLFSDLAIPKPQYQFVDDNMGYKAFSGEAGDVLERMVKEDFKPIHSDKLYPILIDTMRGDLVWSVDSSVSIFPSLSLTSCIYSNQDNKALFGIRFPSIYSTKDEHFEIDQKNSKNLMKYFPKENADKIFKHKQINGDSIFDIEELEKMYGAIKVSGGKRMKFKVPTNYILDGNLSSNPDYKFLSLIFGSFENIKISGESFIDITMLSSKIVKESLKGGLAISSPLTFEGVSNVCLGAFSHVLIAPDDQKNLFIGAKKL